jgi:serine/threonine-protein kinase
MLANAETIEAPSRFALAGAASRGASASASAPVARVIRLIEGATPHISGETRDLLRRRLRAFALVTFSGFAAFLFWSLLFVRVEGANYLFYGHVVVTLLMGVLSNQLCPKCQLSLRQLRVAECLVVGGPAVFFVILNYEKLRMCATLEGGIAHIPNTVGPWITLIFGYAMFVPNTWRRALVVCGVLAAMPILIAGVVYWQMPEFAQLCSRRAFRGIFVEESLIMMFTALSSTVGVYHIGSLRTEAFAARQLGQYRLKRLLGSGGMGEVYLAEHQMMKRPCAIKVIRPEKAGDPQVLARFEREVRATAKLSHWNSIDVFDYGSTDDGTFYYVMEYLPGHNLAELVELHGPLAAPRIVHLISQVCSALAEAHGMGLIHRDLKPANIFAAYRGGLFDVAKVLDFGLAKPLAEVHDSSLTAEGAITGSPLYMSPEQATGSGEIDARSDIYSLGAVMYFMATGHPPFDYAAPLKVIVAHASQHPRPPRELNPQIPVELEEIILRAMEKQPEDRYQDVTALRAALDEVPVDSDWNSVLAADWWHRYGCPKRKALASEAMQLSLA